MPHFEDYTEFARRHGGTAVFVRGRYLFANAAQWHAHPQHRGVEPPAVNTQEFAELLYEYEQAALADLEDKFSKLKQFVIVQSEYCRMGAGPAPPQEALEDLKKLQHKVEEQRHQLEQAQQRLNRRRPQPRNDQFRADQHATATKILDEVRKIEV